ncbi:Gp19/Gp15/Gp42 family protein [Lentzea flava]|uniref:Phage protein Gp19/Gp15/Gp42 n=1 Tax=Lentzea flava TaxID=103732 RepID=A0ABQ2UPV9_9PSEU|nr:Gp19/Gp15/Gp42 family protein [Lentzea flava]MCP2200066.1 Phage protein Gp19/Gp15/Gp42 [Lentzea flava]GGU45905.1 hypothetical protein GCM10010178_43010 [Lentzea flava]
MAYATVDDVEDRLGRELDDQEARIVNTRLNDAELLIRSRIPDLDARITSGRLDVMTVRMIEAEAVLRLVRNPSGFASETDGSYSYTLSEQVASGRLEILADEWSLLGIRRGAYVIRPLLRPAFDPFRLPPGRSEFEGWRG